MNVALASVDFVNNIGAAENTVGLSAPESKVHDDLKSARRRKLARKSENKRSSRVYEQVSAAEMQLEMDSRITHR